MQEIFIERRTTRQDRRVNKTDRRQAIRCGASNPDRRKPNSDRRIKISAQ